MQKVHKYKAGDYFGEKALSDFGKTRLATLICSSECHLASLSKSEYRRCLNKFEQRRLLQNIETLEQMPYFAHWSKNQIKKLLPSLNVVEAVID